jgi:hypothetical protein
MRKQSHEPNQDGINLSRNATITIIDQDGNNLIPKQIDFKDGKIFAV